MEFICPLEKGDHSDVLDRRKGGRNILLLTRFKLDNRYVTQHDVGSTEPRQRLIWGSKYSWSQRQSYSYAINKSITCTYSIYNDAVYMLFTNLKIIRAW